MSKNITKDLDSDRPFEERVFARFDAVDNYLKSLDARVQTLEARNYDTKPVWERALKEILDTREELKETRGELRETRGELREIREDLKETKYELKDFKREVTDRLDQIQMVLLESRVGVRRAHDRIDKLESRPA
jgi:chromosome segregation ATPase